MKSKSYLLCIALLAVCPGLLMADDPAGDPKTLSPEALRTEVAALNRHFPFGFRLEPIQARNVSYSNNLRLPRVYRVEILPPFLVCGPDFWVLTPGTCSCKSFGWR